MEKEGLGHTNAVLPEQNYSATLQRSLRSKNFLFFIVELTQGFYRNEHPDSDTLPVIIIILFLQTVKDSQNKLHIQVSW